MELPLLPDVESPGRGRARVGAVRRHRHQPPDIPDRGSAGDPTRRLRSGEVQRPGHCAAGLVQVGTIFVIN